MELQYQGAPRDNALTARQKIAPDDGLKHARLTHRLPANDGNLGQVHLHVEADREKNVVQLIDHINQVLHFLSQLR